MMPSISEILLFFRALPIAKVAQRVRMEPPPRVIETVLSVSGRGRVEDPTDAVAAAQRACSRWARWFGGLDTCLIRSMVAGALLAGSHDVVLHIGFRPTDQSARAVDGHAWLVVDGDAIELTGLNLDQGGLYETSMQIRMQ